MFEEIAIVWLLAVSFSNRNQLNSCLMGCSWKPDFSEMEKADFIWDFWQRKSLRDGIVSRPWKVKRFSIHSVMFLFWAAHSQTHTHTRWIYFIYVATTWRKLCLFFSRIYSALPNKDKKATPPATANNNTTIFSVTFFPCRPPLTSNLRTSPLIITTTNL